jgi:hypothetical protein
MVNRLFRGGRLLPILFILFLLISPLPRPVQAGEAALEDIVVTNTRDHLLVYFNVAKCITPEMKKAIENGINTTFTFFIRLHEVRNFIWDKEISDLKVSHDIQYDGLKKVYLVRLSELDNKVITLKDFDEAKKIMSEIVGLKVCRLDGLQKGNRYQLSMMAELDKIRLPFYLHYVLFFLSLWDFETDWYTVEFRY